MEKIHLVLLIIDDDPVEVTLVRRLLGGFSDWEVECLEAQNLALARPALARGDLDVILLADRVGSLKEIRREGETRPIVLFTARGEEVVADALRKGADAGIDHQQIDPPALRQAITGALDRHQRQREQARLEQDLMKAQEHEIKRLTQLWAALSRVNHAILQASSRQELFDQACRALVDFGGFSLACIRWPGTDAPSLRVVSLYGARQGYEELEWMAGLPCMSGLEAMIQEEGTWSCKSPENPSVALCPCEAARRSGYSSVAMVPLRMDGKITGALTVLAEARDFFGQQELALLDEVARDLSFALDAWNLKSSHARVEEALRESEERYRLIFNHAPLGILHFDKQGIIRACNETFVSQMGSAHEALVGLDMLTQLPDEGVRKAIQEACDGKKGFFEGPYLSVTGGRSVYGRLHTCALHSPDGQFLGGMGIVEDLSDIKRLEEDRQRITDLYAALSQANQAIIRATDDLSLYKEICQVCVNGAHFDLAWVGRSAPGRSQLEVVASAGPFVAGMQGLPVSANSGFPTAQSAFDRCIRENQEQVCQDWTLGLCKESGDEAIVSFGIRSSAAFPLVCEGRVVGVLNLYSRESGFFKPDRLALLREMSGDIAFALEGFAKEARRQRAEEAFRSTFEQAAVGFSHVAPDGRFLNVNQRFADMLGYTEEELLARTFAEITYPEDAEADAEDVQSLLGGQKQSSSREKRYVRKDGHPLWVKLTASLVRHPDGTPKFFVNVIEDITRQKQDEETYRRLEASLHQAQKMESLGALAAGIAHDMNNILAAIMGTAELMQSFCEPEGPLARSIGTILRASERGRDLVKGLTNFARKGLDEPTLLDLNEIVSNEIELLRRTTLQKVEVRSELDPGLACILGELSAISTALMNLCVNAVDAMPQGGTLAVRTRMLPGAWVELSVSDTGQGMPPEVLARAMDPFFTTKPVGKGTGLGLAIVYGVIKAHGGTVELQSEPGKGATVALRFPASTGNAEPVTPGRRTGEPAQRAMKILLVDDDPLILDTFSQLLASLGHRTQTARDGQEALNRLGADLDVDVVILDQNMPILTGSETLERLRERWPLLPVILATGYMDATTEAKVSGYPRVWILHKPYSLAEMQHVLQAALSG